MIVHCFELNTLHVDGQHITLKLSILYHLFMDCMYSGEVSNESGSLQGDREAEQCFKVRAV